MKDREAWCAAVYGVAKTWTRLSDCTTTRLRGLDEGPQIRGVRTRAEWRTLVLLGAAITQQEPSVA